MYNNKLALIEQQDLMAAAADGLSLDEFKRRRYQQRLAEARRQADWYAAHPDHWNYPEGPPPPEEDESEYDDLKRMMALCCGSSSSSSRAATPSEHGPSQLDPVPVQDTTVDSESSWSNLQGSGVDGLDRLPSPSLSDLPVPTQTTIEDESSWSNLQGSGLDGIDRPSRSASASPVREKAPTPISDESSWASLAHSGSDGSLPSFFSIVKPAEVDASGIAHRLEFGLHEDLSDHLTTVIERSRPWSMEEPKEQQEPEPPVEQQTSTGIVATIKSWATAAWRQVKQVFHSIYD